MNRVELMGRLTRDPDSRYTNADQKMPIARFTLAVDRLHSKKAEDSVSADFISCVAFGKTAEIIDKYCSKGMKIVVCGRIQTGSYTNRDGNKVYTTDVIVSEMEFTESKKDSAKASSASDNKTGPVPDNGFMNIPDGIEEALPFA